MSASAHEILRLFAAPAALREVGPGLGLTARIEPARKNAVEGDLDAHEGVVRDGFAALRHAVGGPVCNALVQGIDGLRARGLPATFIYAFDDAWTIGEELRARISRIVGRDYRLVEDVWAWHIEPGSGRGWPAHRGIAHERLDREAPEIINVWVAFTDVDVDRACMHAIPLDDDPGYPDALARLDAPLESVRALPVSAGDALFWNANVIHWGGRCAPRAAGPRVSGSFTLCREDATARFPELTLLGPLATFDLAARTDAIARMALLYGGKDRGNVPDVVREWATLTHALASKFGRRPSP